MQAYMQQRGGGQHAYARETHQVPEIHRPTLWGHALHCEHTHY